jgi:Pvc16 N-terminal domain
VSNYLAFATVTETLRSLLEAAGKKVVSGTVGTSQRPDTLTDNPARINVFLYQVTPNAAWRNADLPTRRPDGTAVQRPQAAFDLHYVFTLYGDDRTYEPQRILGSVASLLHSQPVLSRGMIRDASQGVSVLNTSNLADQVELVRLSPMGLNLEELSKLWSVFFQVPYKLSLAYQASVVLIDAEEPVQPALPVQARNLYVMPFRQPEVDEVVSDAGPGLPILPGDTIVLRGRNLRGEATRVRVGGVEIVPDAAQVSDGEIRVTLPAGLPAGVLGAQVVHLLWMGTPPALHSGTESNGAPFVLRPKIDSVATSPPTDSVYTVTVGIDPEVKKEQRIVLLLNLLGDPVPPTAPRAFSAASEPRDDDTDPVEFKLRGLPAGKELLVRVQVDGAESLLEKVDGAYANPRVTVP